MGLTILQRAASCGCRRLVQLAPRALGTTSFAVRALSTKMWQDEMIQHVSELRSHDLFMLGHTGDVDAVREMLRREIIRVDCQNLPVPEQLEQSTAKLVEMNTTAVNDPWRKGSLWELRVLVTCAYAAGIGSLPLVFYQPLVRSFNRHCVTMDVPPPSDLNTVLETGAWAWNWMEPPLGTLSFTLLCVQWATAQRHKLRDIDGPSAITDDWEVKVKRQISKRLVEGFPQYNSSIVGLYARAIATENDHSNIEADHKLMMKLLESN